MYWSDARRTCQGPEQSPAREDSSPHPGSPYPDARRTDKVHIAYCDENGLVDVWTEPARDLPVIGRPDVLVVGAGAAGIAAAVSAARRGAKTWLIERSNSLGGLATVGLINLLLTLDDGAGHQVVAGLCQEFVDRLDERGQARFPPEEQWNREDPVLVEQWRRW
jgi:NADPH-dependent 2,4-dienoyl-CoA reductase/sulfur reductase-like enzyme